MTATDETTMEDIESFRARAAAWVPEHLPRAGTSGRDNALTRRIEDDAEGYLRRVLYNLAADGWRRRGTWKQKLLPVLRAGEPGHQPDPTGEIDLRDALVRYCSAGVAPHEAR